MINFIGQCIIILFRSLKYIFKGRVDKTATLKEIANIGFDSLGIAIIIVFVAGSVLSLQLCKQLIQSGAEGYTGAVVAFALLRELAPGFAALAIGARSGTAMAATIANMQITEQIDALKILRVDPILYLIAPRILASMICVPLVVIICGLAGIYGGLIVAQGTINLHPNRFLYSIWIQTEIYDIWVGLIKAVVFGIIIATVSCTRGYLTRGGAKDVGNATISASISTTIALILADFIMSWTFFAD